MTASTVPAEIHRGAVDAEMCGLLWLLVDAGVPLNVTGRAGTGRAALRSALVQLADARDVPGRVLDAESLDGLLRPGGAPPPDAPGDELRGLGVVVVVGRGSDGRRRVSAVHYVRPVERDAEGHLQRRPPAVLYAWDERDGRWEDFGWGVVPELAARAGMSVADFERAQGERAVFLASLAAGGIHERQPVAHAIRGFRLLGAWAGHERH